MTQQLAPATIQNRSLLISLAAIPTIDCIFNQLNNAFKINMGPLSLLQVMRGLLVIFYVVIIVRTLKKDAASIDLVPLPAFAAVAILAVASSKELVVTGALSMSSIAAYGQMLYWILLWTTVCLLCRAAEQRLIVLRGLVWGASLTAMSVVAGLFFGAVNYYKDDRVSSSAGWFDTAKMVTGPLIVGAILMLYLGYSRRAWICSLGALLCCSACVITYARAGSVALIVVVLWLALWRLVIGRRNRGMWLNRFFGLVLAAFVVLPFCVDTSTLLARWGDKGGSGRATFWAVAVDGYDAETLPDQILGVGYNSMSDMLFRNYGDDIKHTHDDLLDELLVSGLVGVVWLIGLTASFLKSALISSIRTPQAAASVAVLLTYICHALLTGQIWGTDAMTYYTLSIACLAGSPDDQESKRVRRVYMLGGRELVT